MRGEGRNPLLFRSLFDSYTRQFSQIRLHGKCLAPARTWGATCERGEGTGTRETEASLSSELSSLP